MYFIERGSKASLELWLAWLPAPARACYRIVHISGTEYGIVANGGNE